MKTDFAEGMALITGATSGIGKELTKIFAENNYDLILIARNKEDLVSFAKDLQSKHDIFIKVIAQDLSKPEAAKDVFKELEKESLSVDILVNNAGFATSGKFEEIEYIKNFEEIQLNVVTLTMLTKLILPEMLKAKSGKILNLASIAAFYPGPFMSVYYATKAYVLSFSEALREELRGTGVTVTVIAPPPLNTGFAKRAKVRNPSSFDQAKITPEQVAKIGYDSLLAGKDLVVPGFLNKLNSLASRLAPYVLSARVIKYFQK
jgi:short-subunit dehydrogenase